MDDWRVIEELDRMKEWDPDAVCDALNLTSHEIINAFMARAIYWIRDNCE